MVIKCKLHAVTSIIFPNGNNMQIVYNIVNQFDSYIYIMHVYGLLQLSKVSIYNAWL